MLRYTRGVQNSIGTSGVAAWELIPPPGKSISVVSFAINAIGAAPNVFRIARTVTPGVTNSFLYGDPMVQDTTPPRKSGTVISVGWSTQPTVTGTGAALAYLAIPGTIGANNIWRPSQPVGISSSLVIINDTANGIVDGVFEWDED